MDDRPVLCVAPNGAGAGLQKQLNETGWRVHLADDFDAARRMMSSHRFLVGLLAPSSIDDATCTEIDNFLVSQNAAEWVGVFEEEALSLPACRHLIIDHLFDHHTRPIDAERLAWTLEHAYGHASLRQTNSDDSEPAEHLPLVGRSPAIGRLLRQIQRVAKVDAPVLIRGESGCGKELTAQAIHRLSTRASGPFVPVNCGAIAPALIQSELFGYSRGAFTGASRDKRGLIEAASGGTIFLDEIGDLPLELQTNLLRFLQEKTINRVGSTQSVPVDVRVIAATNVDLERAVAANDFREDLFYRLNVLPLHVPPLRERKEDIELLAQHFFQQFINEKSHRLQGFSRRATVVMQAHGWPGNVRELMNRVRRAMVMAEGRMITPADLGLEAPTGARAHEALEAARMQAERSAIIANLQQAGRNVSRAARQLGVSRMTLYRLMAKHGIET